MSLRPSKDFGGGDREIQMIPAALLKQFIIAGNGIPALMDSIRNTGVQWPIVVTTKGTVIDGRRRVEACRRLGRLTIPAIVIEHPEVT